MRSSRRGRSYTANAWVKATETTDGERVCISIREGLEDATDGFPFSDASIRVSADEYRELRVTHRAEAGGKTIGVHVFRAGPGVDDEAFLVDAIAVTESAGGRGGGRTAACEA